MTINNDPIELLRAVKEHSLNYQGSRYEMSVITDAFRAFLTVVKKTMRHYRNILKGLSVKRNSVITFRWGYSSKKVHPVNARIYKG